MVASTGLTRLPTSTNQISLKETILFVVSELNRHFRTLNPLSVIDNTKCFAQSGTDECWMKKTVRKLCTKKVLYQRLPILSWLPKYDKSCAVGDLVAGITVGLTVVPQSLAYANIAGLPPQQGLYTAFLGSFIYIVLGSCKDVPMGPTSIASLLTYQSVKDKGPHHAILLCFLTGIVQLLLGFFGLGEFHQSDATAPTVLTLKVF